MKGFFNQFELTGFLDQSADELDLFSDWKVALFVPPIRHPACFW
jgi:hypothetical protein